MLLNKLETEDSEKTTFQEEVSQDTFLLNLSLDNTTCKDIPKFEKSVTEYECVFWWSATEMPRVIPTLNPLCRDCVLLMPSPERSSSHLSLSLQTQKEDVWESGRVWTRRFFYGESHILPIVVLSGDRSTNTTYRVHLERDAPWWMKTSTEREISSTTKQISFWASVVAYGMAMFSASTFLALTRLIQFMDLTTEIKGTPQVYQDPIIHGMVGFNRRTRNLFFPKALRRVLPENLLNTCTSILTLEHLHFYTYNGTEVSK